MGTPKYGHTVEFTPGSVVEVFMSFIFLSKDLCVQTDYDQCGRIEMEV